MSIRKLSVALLLPVSLLLLLFWGAVHIATTQKAQYSYPSPSGRFVLQSVLLAPWLGSWNDLAYIRVIDTHAPGSAYRTPLYDKHYTDMRSHEDDRTVGIVWFDFDKQQQTFEIGVPEWQDSWLNRFISNTPYRIIEN
ncbi:hypothetical protein OEG79_00500 [Pseudomonas sp. Z8(2022)]|jgi:hypothetical protein|uniref:hypothetical protein n=1 Tax=Pseudomonadaceae TaxID=135621 RepID=UPI0021F3CF09|nr:hypothetical protein [Pseudomonas sp. Z8(2022)]UYP30607.1 hypothetical protein OEG79_00500 [Pseudomonas sp. Z8(2022)]